MKNPRKAYQGPKYVAKNPMATFFGGMSDQHKEEAQKIAYKTHSAMVNLCQGSGTKEDWDRVVGAINMANVLCEQGIGNEFRESTIDARDALLEVGKRFMTTGRFVFKGDELTAINDGLACHDAQIENSRYLDIERASNEVIRRVKHHINSTTVQAEMRKEAA